MPQESNSANYYAISFCSAGDTLYNWHFGGVAFCSKSIRCSALIFGRFGNYFGSSGGKTLLYYYNNLQSLYYISVFCILYQYILAPSGNSLLSFKVLLVKCTIYANGLDNKKRNICNNRRTTKLNF